jgi:Reverse transcriptase (RNA-dependent DNA polymerase)/Group II intron, maturase-specific domain
VAASFGSIPHDRLMARVAEKVSDGRVLDLIRGWLKADILKGLERWTPTPGSPQGAVISPLLANIYLDPLDAVMAGRGYRMARYADDFVILCRTREEAEAALEDVRAWVNGNGLALHPEKTHVGDCRQPGQGFEFLGYRFEAGQRQVRKKSLNGLKDSLWAKTKRTRGDSLERIVADLNRTLCGWFGYFKHAHYTIFERLDAFTRRRLRALLRRHEKRASRMGMSRADHQRWPKAFFAEAGLFALHTDWLLLLLPSRNGLGRLAVRALSWPPGQYVAEVRVDLRRHTLPEAIQILFGGEARDRLARVADLPLERLGEPRSLRHFGALFMNAMIRRSSSSLHSGQMPPDGMSPRPFLTEASRPSAARAESRGVQSGIRPTSGASRLPRPWQFLHERS